MSAFEPPSKTLKYKSTLDAAGLFTFKNTVAESASSFNSTFLVIYLDNSAPPDATASEPPFELTIFCIVCTDVLFKSITGE